MQSLRTPVLLLHTLLLLLGLVLRLLSLPPVLLLERNCFAAVAAGRMLQLLRHHRQPASLQLVEAFFWRYDR